MFDISNLEIHAWHACNLFCESCSHYSSLGLQGGPTAEVCEDWMRGWSTRVRPRVFSIVGGEPTLNHGLTTIVRAAGEIWPNSRIRLVSNGFLLYRHTGLAPVLAAIGERAILEISSHHSGAEFQAQFEMVRRLADEWRTRYGVNILIKNSDQRWTRRYRYTDGRIDFITASPRQAWEGCVDKWCPQIFVGHLWKCPPVAYFGLMKEHMSVEERWQDLWLRYRPLESSCTDAELHQFLTRQEEEMCGICPAQLERFELRNPLVNFRRG